MSTVDRVMLAAQRRAVADGIVIDNPRARRAHQVFDFLVEHGKLRASDSKQAVLMAAPSQTGKSTIINTYAARKNTPEALEERRIPVLVVTLDANVTRKGLAENILEAIEERGFQTGPHSGSETKLLRRVRLYLASAKVELLVLDEIHHLVHSESQKLAKSVSETIKRMLIKGVCPIVMAGIEDAYRLPQANSQLAQRCLPSIDLSPLQATQDGALMIHFLDDYAAKLEEQEVICHSPELTTEETAACICDVSRGILGAACNLIKDALCIATLGGRNTITRQDLSEATDKSFIAKGLYDRNPFIHGLRTLSPIRL